jgi:hypothetical protein
MWAIAISALKSPTMQALMNDHAWLWPAFEMAHFVGMVLLIGTVGLFDLRMLGFARGLPTAPLQRLIPFGLAGFAINLLTGLGFIAGNQWAVTEYGENPAFHWKVACMALAGLNALAFYVTGLSHRVDALGPTDSAPLAAKAIATIGLTLWVGVICFGRLLPYLGDAF